ncbi:MAG: hypothetical protein QOD58_2591 [Mycobacterium sp.]|jgi:cytochrome P450|nr:hypothetical protein [Mycobacterium sp.]
MTNDTKVAVKHDFSYDPFDARVMADPLPYYRTLRDEYPVYYVPQWDMFAFSRFDDIWRVLEVNDGTFVASEGTLPPASVLAHHNSGPIADPPLHPLPFHAVFDADLYGAIRRAHSQPLRPKSVTSLETRIRALANERLDLLLSRGSFDLTQDYGGVVAASMVCDLLGISTDLASQVLAAVNAGSLAAPGEGVDTAGARPNYLEFLVPVVERRRAEKGGELPVVDGLLAYQLPDGSALNDVEVATQMLCIFIGGTETVPKIVAHGLWELSQRPEQMAAVRADPAATVPIAREEMLRYCAPAQWFARTARKPFTIHGETIEPGQRVITLLASANRDEREYPEPDEFIWDRPIKRSLVFGRGQHFCIGYHLARLEVAVLVQEWLRRVPDFAIRGEDATRLPSSFQWGWNNIPVEV